MDYHLLPILTSRTTSFQSWRHPRREKGLYLGGTQLVHQGGALKFIELVAQPATSQSSLSLRVDGIRNSRATQCRECVATELWKLDSEAIHSTFGRLYHLVCISPDPL